MATKPKALFETLSTERLEYTYFVHYITVQVLLVLEGSALMS